VPERVYLPVPTVGAPPAQEYLGLGSSVAALSVELNADDAPVIDFIVAAAATTTFGTSLTEATQMQRDEVDFDSGRRDYCSYIHRTLPSRMQGAHTPFLV